MNPIPVPDLGGYLREQRQAARLSLRQLSDVAGVSNPYLSQIERGLKKPSAEILQQLAKGLRISAESLYVRAGILEEKAESETGHQPDVAAAILADPRLSDRQRRVLLDVYASLVGDDEPQTAPSKRPATAPSSPKTTKTTQNPKNTKTRRTTNTPKTTAEGA
jgi:transcriptional regulator with XRE-family HTH domain